MTKGLFPKIANKLINEAEYTWKKYTRERSVPLFLSSPNGHLLVLQTPEHVGRVDRHVLHKPPMDYKQ